MKKYKHKKLNCIATIVEPSNITYQYNIKGQNYFITNSLLQDSCDWEKVEENPWFISKIGPSKVTGAFFYFIKDGLYSSNPEAITGTVSAPTLIQEGWNIHTVSNGKEEFSVGDVMEYQSPMSDKYILPIKSFELRNDIIYVTIGGMPNCESIFCVKPVVIGQELKKAPVLYVTEDNIPRYEYQKEWWIIKDDCTHLWRFTANDYTISKPSDIENGKIVKTWKVFSTKESAEIWMSFNNPKQYWVSRIIGISSGFTYCGTSPSTTTIYGYQTQNLSFSSEQEAKDFIDNNQKKYSIEDIKKAVHSMWGQTIPLDVIKLQEAVIKNLKNGTN